MSAQRAYSAPVNSHDKPSKLLSRKIIDDLPPKKREQIAHYKVVLGYLLNLPSASDKSELQKIKQFQTLFNQQGLPLDISKSLAVLRGKKQAQCPNKSTFYRWLEKLEKFSDGNTAALTKQYKGRQRQVYGWEQQAIEFFNQPSKPGYADVAYWLRTDEGFDSATASRVKRYLKSLPETLGKKSAKRMGKDFYTHNLKPHKFRDNEALPVGYGYEGDGHTIDVYLAHPVTGNLYRPELTIWIDVRSRYIVGWYLSSAESAVSTLFALSHALLKHDHVPCELFMDNGSGFKAKMMNDDVTGFFTRMGIRPTFSLPGNSKGKGLVEGFFKIFRNRHDKHPKFKNCYCGHDMAPEINRRLPEMVKRGIRTPPAHSLYEQSVAKFMDDYNNEPKPVLNGQSPAQLWQQLQPVPVHVSADALVQPRTIRTVLKWRVQLDNRKYEAAELAHYNGREVIVEYSLHTDGEVRILDEKEVFICIARLVGKVDHVPESRIVEQQQKSLKASIKRDQRKIDEKIARSKPIINHEDSIEALNDTLPEVQTSSLEEDDFNPFDCLQLGDSKDQGEDDLDINDTFNL